MYGPEYISHQDLTPNYISGQKGEYENVTAVTTTAACNVALAAGNNIMYTGNMGYVAWANAETYKDITFKTGVTTTVHHEINGNYTTVNLQAGAAVFPMVFDEAAGSTLMCKNGADLREVRFAGATTVNVGSYSADGGRNGTIPGSTGLVFDGGGYGTYLKHHANMTDNDSAPGVQDPSMGDATNGAGLVNFGYGSYDFWNYYYNPHSLNGVSGGTYANTNDNSPDYSEARWARGRMTNGSQRDGWSHTSAIKMANSKHNKFSFLMFSDSSQFAIAQMDADTNIRFSHLTIIDPLDAAADQSVTHTNLYPKSMWFGGYFVENGVSDIDGGGIQLYGDDCMVIASNFEMLSLGAADRSCVVHSAGNDAVVYCVRAETDNASYGVSDNASDGVVAGNNSDT